MNVAKIRMLRWIKVYTRKERIWNEEIHLKIRVASIDEKIWKISLKWFHHVQRGRAINAVVKKSELIQVKGTKKIEEYQK